MTYSIEVHLELTRLTFFDANLEPFKDDTVGCFNIKRHMQNHDDSVVVT